MVIYQRRKTLTTATQRGLQEGQIRGSSYGPSTCCYKVRGWQQQKQHTNSVMMACSIVMTAITTNATYSIYTNALFSQKLEQRFKRFRQRE